MTKKNKIMVATTGRADYGLLYPLIKRIRQSSRYDLYLTATGTHLSPLHGQTINLIEKDGLEVTDTVNMTVEGDTEHAICSSISTGLAGFSALLDRTDPDLLVVLGDRYELWSACIAAVVHKIPIAHIHGGEATFGVIDDSIRHCITKMSAIHFPSMDVYARRIIQMGEHPERVYVVGAIGLDNIVDIPFMSRKELSKHAGVDFEEPVALLTYHPVTLDSYDQAGQQIRDILAALVETDLSVLMTMPNSDPSSNTIYEEMERYSRSHPGKFKLVKNLGQKGYLSAMKHARLMVGNSSSGIIESASFKLPVVNIGDRQKGRLKPPNVIDCICARDRISKALEQALSDDFKRSFSQKDNPYGDGRTSLRIMNVLESLDFDQKQEFIKKGFYDLSKGPSQVKVQRVP